MRQLATLSQFLHRRNNQSRHVVSVVLSREDRYPKSEMVVNETVASIAATSAPNAWRMT
jgi:hypothetical protein